MHRPEHAATIGPVEEALAALDGVHWAQVDAVLGRVVVALEDGRVSAADLIGVIEGVERARGLTDERFPHDRPEHPSDREPMQRQLLAVAADVAGLGLGLLGRAVRANPVSAEVASLVSLLDATPALRRSLEGRLGHGVTDLGLAVGSALAQGLAQGPLGLLVDIGHRALLVDELRAARDAWVRREPDLYGARSLEPTPALPVAVRPAPLPTGPVETYADRAAVATIAAAAATAALTRDPRLMVTATAAATPKAARLGREAFAARFGRDLARSGVVPMDSQALRRLDRVDTVVIDSAVLTNGHAMLAELWTDPDAHVDEEQVWLTARRLFDATAPAGPVRDGRWSLAMTTDRFTERAAAAAVRLRAGGRRTLAVRRDGDLVGLVAVDIGLDPLAEPLLAAAREVGRVVIAGRSRRLGPRLGVDEVVAGGSHLAGSVRQLQADGAVVALVSARWHYALACADVGIGVPAGPRPPSGADLITRPGLADAYQILQAVPTARATSRRAVMLAAYGSGAGALLALAGPRTGATTRALVAVNGAAAAAVVAGAWSAATLDRRPPPRPAESVEWHALPTPDVLELLGATTAGLDASDATARHRRRPAEAEPVQPGILQASFEELANPLTPALATGAGMSAASGSITDAALIGTVMTVNALIGGVQRVGATRSLQRLIDTSAVPVRVRRENAETLTTAEDVVAGDLIILQAGDAVPADCRVLEANGLEVDESSLTGESQLVAKSAEPSAAAVLAERQSMLYAGTAVAAGGATGIVVAVGPETELGRSAQDAQAAHRPGGVQARLRQLTKVTIPISLGAGAAVVAGGLLRGRRLSTSLGTGVSLAVAAVPEGLPLVASVAQLSAARRLSHRNALVRNAATIEALGRVDALCFDKTGTLTEGHIALHRVAAHGHEQPLDALDEHARRVLAAGLRASPEHRDGQRLAHPTDRAVVDGAAAAGVSVDVEADRWSLELDLPFESSRGYHAVVGCTAAGRRLVVKGAPELVLPRCTHDVRPDGLVTLDADGRGTLEAHVENLARRGYRVLAVAERPAAASSELSEEQLEDLHFVGLLALTDPVRTTAAQAVRSLRDAGISVQMLTGDHPSTAEAIAADLGLLNGHRVVTGADLDALGDAELDAVVNDVSVFARVTPSHKVRIVSAMQRVGHVVAVTGDGANDAPAIRRADVGIALGLRGTNAAKEAADIVVTDDRLETIVDAIVEGRAMWSSVRDAIAVLLGGNLGEIAFTVGTALLLPGGSPLNARQLLLVNLLTDMLPAMALAIRPPSAATPETLLHEGPDASLGTALSRDIIMRGALTAGAGAGAWVGGRMTGVTSRHAGTVALVGIVGAQLGQTLVIGRRSPLVVAATVVSAGVLAGVVQTPGVSQFFGCQPLGPLGWGVGISNAAAASLAAPLVARAWTAVADR